jgi:hypothetical protein
LLGEKSMRRQRVIFPVACNLSLGNRVARSTKTSLLKFEENLSMSKVKQEHRQSILNNLLIFILRERTTSIKQCVIIRLMMIMICFFWCNKKPHSHYCLIPFRKMIQDYPLSFWHTHNNEKNNNKSSRIRINP